MALFKRLSWNALLVLSSPTLPRFVQQNLEARIATKKRDLQASLRP